MTKKDSATTSSKAARTSGEPPKLQGKTALTRRYRAWYAKLPAGLQLVGLQLWLPVFFTLMFCCCYILAFHEPKIQNVPVGYVGNSAQDQRAAGQIQSTLKGAVAVRNYASQDQAIQATKHGQIAAAFDTRGTSDTLYIASAHQFQAASLAKEMLTPVAQASGKPVQVKDLAPLPAHDLFGTVSLYLMLVTCIGGYMVGMFLGMMGGPLYHRTRFGVLLATSFILSFIIQLLAGPVIGAVQGHFFVLWMLSWAWMFTIGSTVNGLSYFVGRFIPAVALTLFVFLSMPSSGGAYPAWFMPGLFQWLNHVVVGSGITEMFRHILYGVGPGLSRGFIMMLCYLAIGLLLAFVGKPYWERKRARRILAGETTMFMDAQRANTAHGQEIRKQIFKDAGLQLPEDKPNKTDDNGDDEKVEDLFTTSHDLERAK